MSDTAAESSAPTPRLARLDVGQYALPEAVLDKVMTPALVIYESRVRANIAHMLSLMGGEPSRWRPHLKTTKTPEVYSLLIEAGVRQFKCATVREARCLLEAGAAQGVDDIDMLLAYPLQGPALQALAALQHAFPTARLSVLSEDADHARAVPAELGVFVDVNPGMNRTGVPLSAPARLRAVIDAVIDSMPGRLRGLHYYDGHVHADGAAERRRHVHAMQEAMLGFLDELQNDGIRIEELITSGTPAFQYALDFPGFANGTTRHGTVQRVSPGTVVFHDYQEDMLLEDLQLDPAAVLMARVVSHPTDGIVTCDAGSKSLAADYGDPVAFAIGHAQLQARRPSEEHLPFAHGPELPPPLGEVLYLVPRHICPTVNLAEQALWVADDGAVRVVDIAARGHELLLAPL